MTELVIDTPPVFEPLLYPSRFKGADGGRGSGKSHFFAELLAERMIAEPDLKWVCIREIQKSLRFSAKALLESKLQLFGCGHLFDVQRDLIKRLDGSGVVIFNGMQDHTADSIKSLEDFDGAWIEEAQSISQRSWDLLEPTIRKQDSEIWASWNPKHDYDPIAKFFTSYTGEDLIWVHANIQDNPFASETLLNSYERARDLALKQQRQGDAGAWAKFEHIWHGAYDVRSEAQVLAGSYEIRAFEPELKWSGPYLGIDWGFSVDPTVMVQVYFDDAARVLYVRREVYKCGVETVDLPSFFARIPDSAKRESFADNARPEQISHCNRHGYRKMRAAPKWGGSVEDGISWLKGLSGIVIHPDAKHTANEAKLWSYKTDKHTGEVLTTLIDANNHCWDAIRYAVSALIRGRSSVKPATAGQRTY